MPRRNTAPATRLPSLPTDGTCVQQAVESGNVVFLPNLLAGQVDADTGQVFVSFWLKEVAIIDEDGHEISFGRMTWRYAPRTGPEYTINIAIDRVSVKFLQQAKFGPDLVVDNNDRSVVHVRGVNVYASIAFPTFEAFFENERQVIAEELRRRRASATATAGTKRAAASRT